MNRKRKATDQLSPYSKDPEDIPAQTERDAESVAGFKRAKAKREAPASGSSLKGIFGTVSLAASSQETDVIAGLNQSFLEAVQKVLCVQSNKNLKFLFDQYEKFMSDIQRNSK